MPGEPRELAYPLPYVRLLKIKAVFDRTVVGAEVLCVAVMLMEVPIYGIMAYIRHIPKPLPGDSPGCTTTGTGTRVLKPGPV